MNETATQILQYCPLHGVALSVGEAYRRRLPQHRFTAQTEYRENWGYSFKWLFCYCWLSASF